jgi:hypothetical protein
LASESVSAGRAVAVTWRDRCGRFTVRFSRWLLGPQLAQLRGLSVSPLRCPMATAIPSTALVPVAPVFASTERLALAGFLAGYSGLTRQTYELDLR